MKYKLSFSKPLPNAQLRVISLGAGVQSSVMALMAAKGEVGPMPDCAIFADTQWEPKEVYTHLDWLEAQLPFPVYRVTAGNIRADHVALARGKRKPVRFMPLYGGGMGMGRRHCTSEYKIQPVRKKIRELLGLRHRQRASKTPVVESWLGISTDEIQRLKESRDKWMVHRWPLIEESIARSDCLKWFANHYPNRVLAKSACVGCPFHSNAEWRRIRDEMPDAWADAIEFDKVIRNAGIGSAREAQYLHRSSVPLDEVDLLTPVDKGQKEFTFLDECDGMCGV